MCSFLAIHINELNLVFLMAYRPPPDYTTPNTYNGPHLSSSFKSIILDNIAKTLEDLPLPTPDIILAGDFNFPKASWRNGLGIRHDGNSHETQMMHSLMDLCDNHNLLQQVTFGTRPTPSGGSNTLDLIFTNNHQLIGEISHRQTALSDHEIITCYTNHILPSNPKPVIPSHPTTPTLSSYNLPCADLNQITTSISNINWPDIFNNRNSDDHANHILSHTINTVNLHCPKYKNKPGQSNKIFPRVRRQKKRILKNLKFC